MIATITILTALAIGFAMLAHGVYHHQPMNSDNDRW
jgi:hypothetical protein